MEVEEMNLSHVKLIQEIENISFESPWSYRSIKNEIDNSFSINLICKINKNIVGYLMGWMIKNEFQLNNICIKHEFRKNKYGYFLLNTLLDKLKRDNCRSVFLEVDEKNYNAIKLYTKAGFVILYVRKKYYNNGSDALVMKKNII